jgi:hypothetical protein
MQRGAVTPPRRLEYTKVEVAVRVNTSGNLGSLIIDMTGSVYTPGHLKIKKPEVASCVNTPGHL